MKVDTSPEPLRTPLGGVAPLLQLGLSVTLEVNMGNVAHSGQTNAKKCVHFWHKQRRQTTPTKVLKTFDNNWYNVLKPTIISENNGKASIVVVSSPVWISWWNRCWANTWHCWTDGFKNGQNRCYLTFARYRPLNESCPEHRFFQFTDQQKLLNN